MFFRNTVDISHTLQQFLSTEDNFRMQSDVIGMVAEDMSPVVTYEYDEWSKLLNVSGEKKDTVGKLNPFRYRGYVYEKESGLYYVTSRYYDLEVGRFLRKGVE